MPHKDIENPAMSWYSIEEVAALLERAKAQGYDLGPNADLNRLTIEQLQQLLEAVN